MAQDYDKLLKEILREVFPSITEKVLGIQARKIEILPFELQYTTELKTDQLYKITPLSGAPFALHVDLQTKNDKTMAARMLAYCGLIHLLHGLPVQQCVLYTGKGRLSMPDAIAFPGFTYRYQLLDMRQFPYQAFLASDQPQEVLLAIISDFGEESHLLVTQKILRRLRELSSSERELSRRVRQLSRLGTLRNVSTLIIQEALAMAITLDKTKDGLYLLGKEERQEEITLNMLKEGLSEEVISRVTGLSPREVNRLKGGLPDKK
ncbi:MAG: hypothetical protein H7Z75_15230 [Ferruginibacter sp.]|nr:hypothetical protein [Cytophagales bacterium]